MFVTNQKMFHYHNPRVHNSLWKKDKIIDNTSEDFINEFYKNVLEFNSIFIDKSEKLNTLEDILSYYFIKEIDDETLRRWLIDARKVISELNIAKREFALENVREKYYPNKVSRKRAIWLCQDPQLKFWKASLHKKAKLYEVSVTGEIFISSAELLPKKGLSYKDTEEAAHEYWRADIENLPEESLEYLAQGKIHILKKHR